MTTPRPLLLAGTCLGVLALGVSSCSDSGTSPSPVVTAPVPTAQQPALAPCATTEISFYGCAYTRRGVALTGQVYELTQTGKVGIAGAHVYCEACGLQTHSWSTTDSNGFYRFSADLENGGGVWLSSGFLTAIGVERAGYQDPPGLPPLRGPMFHIPTGPGWREVSIDGDTRFDIQLVRQ